MLRVEEIVSGYGGIEALHGIDLEVGAGEIVAVLGPNGAGKSTLARVVAGLHPAKAGRVLVDDQVVTRLPAHKRVRLGIALVPENRALFPELSVADNLILGAYSRNRGERSARLDEILTLFPQLAERTGQPAGLLSGGEQQMLAIGRALMSRPKYLILDEPSLGLAPKIVRDMFVQLAELAAHGTGILLNEQNATRALEVADKAAILERGKLILAGSADKVAGDPRVITSYLGEVV